MGVHARAVRPGVRRLPRDGAAGRLLRLRRRRGTAARDPGAAPERSWKYGAAQAWGGPGRDSAALDSAQRRVRRSGAVVVVEGGLGRALDLHRPARPLTTAQSTVARAYVAAV